MLRGWAGALLLLAPLALASAPVERGWWQTTLLDLDRDGLDDALAPLLAAREPLVVLAAFARAPGPADLAALRAAGFEVSSAYANFDVVAVRASPLDVPRLLDVPGVVFVERNDELRPLLKESVPLLGAPQVWRDHRATGKGIVVAVLDDGAYGRHPDFDGKLAGSYDAAADGLSPFPLAESVPIVPAGSEGHATHVAGTIVGPGTESGGVYRGVAPDARFVDVKVFRAPNQTSSEIVLRGLDWTLGQADALGIRVASMSLGGRASDGKDALSRAVNVAVDKGLVVVAAAGNAGPGEATVSSPGAAEKAITVGAVDKRKRLADYSSRGPTLDGRTKPDLVAPGSAITSTIPPASLTAIQNLLGADAQLYYGALSGTSMAAPHVSGVVALMLQMNPDLTPNEIKRMLVATAQDLGEPGRDNETGFGFVNAIAAAQVAEDPRLLESPELASRLAALPEPGREDVITRAQVEMDALRRSGALLLASAGLLAAAALVILVAALRRR